MGDAYVHGIVVKEGSGQVQVIRSPSQSVVGIVGTAPQSKLLIDNTPVAFSGKKPALEAAYPAGSSGDRGSIYDGIVGVHEQTPAQLVLIKAKSDKESDIFAAIDALLEAESVTGFKPKILVAPGLGNFNPSVSPTPASPSSPSSSENQEEMLQPEETETRLLPVTSRLKNRIKEVSNG